MKTRVQKWGNSLALPIPKSFAEEAGLRSDAAVELSYENEHVEMPYVSDAAMLGSLIEEKGVRQADVIRDTGISQTVLSLVFSGKREFTRSHIKALSKCFDVDPTVFLGPGIGTQIDECGQEE